ncbi:hypothetical protein GCM10010464_39080 [Pseudonocardia yunnanensis]
MTQLHCGRSEALVEYAGIFTTLLREGEFVSGFSEELLTVRHGQRDDTTHKCGSGQGELKKGHYLTVWHTG